MERPRPVPRRRVEKKGRKRRSRISSVMPWPVSAITISAIVWVSLAPVRTVKTRRRLDCMASAALSMRLLKARFKASASAMTGGRLVPRCRRTSIPSSRPANSVNVFSTTRLRSVGVRLAAGKSASAANWSTSWRNVSTEERITSVELRRTWDESSVRPRSMWRSMRSADSAMGVSGFLISWATRCATSFHAICFCARNTSVTLSITTRCPCKEPRSWVTVKIKCSAPREFCASISVEAAGKRRLRRRTRPISSADSVGNSD